METLTTDRIESILNNFFTKVEYRIPSNSTLALNLQFWTLCAGLDILPSDRELLAESLVTNKSVRFNDEKTGDKISFLMGDKFFHTMVDSIKVAAKEKINIDQWREEILEMDLEIVKNHIIKRLETLLDKLSTTNSLFDISKINNLLDETPRLGLKRIAFVIYVSKKIEEDTLLNSMPEVTRLISI